jgi:hypothetical protein
MLLQTTDSSPAAKQAEERAMHEAKLGKMEAEMKMVFQQKVQEKEQKLKQSEEELYARHREMKEALEKQRLELEDKKRRIESGRPLTPEKGSVSRRVDSDQIRIASRRQMLTIIEKALRSRQVNTAETLLSDLDGARRMRCYYLPSLNYSSRSCLIPHSFLSSLLFSRRFFFLVVFPKNHLYFPSSSYTPGLSCEQQRNPPRA